jgi:two-component system nitrogen regulation response regulator GlnG
MASKPLVWIIDDDRSIRWVLEKTLAKEHYCLRFFDRAEGIIEQLIFTTPDAIISDNRMPGMSGLALLEKIKAFHRHRGSPEVPVIIMSVNSDLDSAVLSYQRGAFDYLPKPFDLDDVAVSIKRAIAHSQKKKIKSVSNTINTAVESTELMGKAPAMQEVFRAIARLSQSNITVLINGESGTGKERVARAFHQHSPRALEPFIALNMAAIPKHLIESELFGLEKSTFTGAATQQVGRFEQADGGTLFLDEIGDMPVDTQTRLLGVLADAEFYRIGGTTPVKVNVRVIAATHQNLEKLVNVGRFREDLFHRLNVIRIHLPKLADRNEDVPILANYFLKKAAKELSIETKIFRSETELYLSALPWPGNVRQLENVCRWLTVMASGREVHISDLPPELLNDYQNISKGVTWQDALKTWVHQELIKGKQGVLQIAVPKFERNMIETVLSHTGGRKRDASILLGWGRNTLTRKIKELGMNAAGSDD